MALYLVSNGGTVQAADTNQIVNAFNGLQVVQAVGVTSNITTTSVSPTFVAMTDMSVTLTAVGTRLKATFTAVVHNSAANDVFLALFLDGVQATSAIEGYMNGTVSQTVTVEAVWTNVSAASHTIAGYWAVSAGTATQANNWRTLTVENWP